MVHCQAKCREAPRRGESSGQEMVGGGRGRPSGLQIQGAGFCEAVFLSLAPRPAAGCRAGETFCLPALPATTATWGKIGVRREWHQEWAGFQSRSPARPSQKPPNLAPFSPDPFPPACEAPASRARHRPVILAAAHGAEAKLRRPAHAEAGASTRGQINYGRFARAFR